ASGSPAATTAIVPGIGAAASAAAPTATAPDVSAAASAAAPAGAGEHETVLLPRTGLRDAAGSPWGRGRGAEAAQAPGEGAGAQGLAGVPEAPETRETPETPEIPQIREAPSPITPLPPVTSDTQATAAAPHVPAGLGTLRAVPSVPPKAAAGPGSADVSGVTAGTNPGTILPPPAMTPLAPVSPVPPASPFFEPLRTGPLGSGTPEVRPPSGVQGPGWAFATTRIQASSSEEALHEEARRLARLLVSEIKLYNEEQVEAGRRNRDIYERLREDIDRSRQMYEERVEPRLVKSTDYFYQELVRILAAGDSKALGI
ncbi:MAG TPA: hypothetical protein VHB47_12215, partial [Thermoanaerobaculia bacterium]|nr:hypothetical protein [Thermoanaerobaculia bacterium]